MFWPRAGLTYDFPPAPISGGCPGAQSILLPASLRLGVSWTPTIFFDMSVAPLWLTYPDADGTLTITQQKNNAPLVAFAMIPPGLPPKN